MISYNTKCWWSRKPAQSFFSIHREYHHTITRWQRWCVQRVSKIIPIWRRSKEELHCTIDTISRWRKAWSSIFRNPLIVEITLSKSKNMLMNSIMWSHNTLTILFSILCMSILIKMFQRNVRKSNRFSEHIVTKRMWDYQNLMSYFRCLSLQAFLDQCKHQNLLFNIALKLLSHKKDFIIKNFGHLDHHDPSISDQNYLIWTRIIRILYIRLSTTQHHITFNIAFQSVHISWICVSRISVDRISIISCTNLMLKWFQGEPSTERKCICEDLLFSSFFSSS